MIFSLTPIEVDIIQKLLLGTVLGFFIGLERELDGSPAGMKTYTIVALGSTLFSIGALAINTRIAAGIVTGIGFIGAGTIFKSESHVRGLTTAAGIWAVAAVGFITAAGMTYLAVISTALILIILVPLEMLEKKVRKKARQRSVKKSKH